MPRMTEDEVEHAIEEVLQHIDSHDASDSDHATIEQTREFWEGVMEGLRERLESLR